MARGDVLASEKHSFTQPETGARVLPLTDAPGRNQNVYYNKEQFTAGSESPVFRSDRSGTRQLYQVHVDSGRIVQLTDAPGDGVWGFTVDAAHGVGMAISHGSTWRYSTNRWSPSPSKAAPR